MHNETQEEVRLAELAKARQPKSFGTEADWSDIGAEPTQVFLVQARSFGNTQAQCAFLTEREAIEFRDECTAFEATRYTEEEAYAAHLLSPDDCAHYKALRDDFDDRHPWRRLCRGTKFIVKAQPVGRPIKAAA